MRLPSFFAVALAIAVALPVRAQAPVRPPDTLDQRLLACASCHARKDVNDAYFPRIGGKPAGYLYNQLLNFQNGRRQSPLMTYMVQHMPDAYLREIADHFAAQHLPAAQMPQPPLAPGLLERGRLLALHGEHARQLPACVACHGPTLTGVQPAIPGLLGLPRDYVNAQLGAWRNGSRKAHGPDCMATIASRMTVEDINAVSSWLAAQPLPADPAPAASIARPLPLACGSAPDAAGAKP
jgi:cytochrome c553